MCKLGRESSTCFRSDASGIVSSGAPELSPDEINTIINETRNAR